MLEAALVKNKQTNHTQILKQPDVHIHHIILFHDAPIPW